ncbi:MAG: dethiobiotin synthase [Magnetococcales bacterium]|nr:dethiobiotin synthase [Magnetococcales bacterium]
MPGWELFRVRDLDAFSWKAALEGGCFVTGTDTGVGKTVVAAWLVRRLGGCYWKPVQAGRDPEGDDGEVVARLAGVSQDRIFPPLYAFDLPRSPHEGAGRAGVKIDLNHFVLPTSSRPLVVEGAGGVMVPLGNGHYFIDVMKRLGLPVVVVCRTALGTINHSLLTLEALRSRGIGVAGVIFHGPPDEENRRAVTEMGRVRELAWIPWRERLTAEGDLVQREMDDCGLPLEQFQLKFAHAEMADARNPCPK